MATDGQDYPRRRKFHGKFYAELKKGLEPQVLAEYALAGVAREISSDPMPLLGAVINAIVANQNGLFLLDQRSAIAEYSQIIGVALKGDISSGTNRFIFSAVCKAALDLRPQRQSLSPQDYRSALCEAIGIQLLRQMSFEYADGYAAKAHGIPLSNVHQLWDHVASIAAVRAGEMVESIVTSKKGRPRACFSKVTRQLPHIDCGSVESLQNTFLALNG